MKKSAVFLLAVGLGLLTGLSSCVDGDDSIGGGSGGNGNGTGPGGGNNDKSEPVITIQESPEKFLRPGDSVSFQVLLESNSSIERLSEVSFELFQLNSSGEFEILPSYTDTVSKAGIPSSGERFGALLRSTEFNSGDTLKARFTLKNTDGGFTREVDTVIISEFMDDRVLRAGEDSVIRIQHALVDDPNAPLNKFGLFYTANSYQMGYVVSGQAREADIADDSQSDSTFAKRWRSETDTRFVKANNADLNFTYPLDVKVEGAYYAGNPTKTVENIQEGDFIIANVRNDDKFILIRITRVLEDTEDATQRFIQFKGTGKDLYPG